ncbi:Clavaminate synthase-like protein [Schizophyllum amplum]|uniref:Clavaminate synthase-like protein n=1 Tax=Schizophyllum amplum TaxID=97359 RepID=A0A550C7J1_9AGAR|nr:Clavaminate synthase-like protein [Auriculariopsis ampla]
MSKAARLPIIDISPWLSDDPSNAEARTAVSAALHSACVNYGFFYLDISSYADPAEPEELTTLARKFFDLPQEEKEKIALRNEDNARGYARLKENVTNGKADNHEGIDFYKPVDNPDKTKPLWGTNQWPSVPGFKEKYEAWVEKMKALGMITMHAMAVGLGMTEKEWQDLRCQVDHSFWVMRTIGYPPLPNNHDGFSCGAHKDYGCLTFLYTDPTKKALQVFMAGAKPEGLQLDEDLPVEQDKDGFWINADPIPGCVVCNIGEMWDIWTNGLYRATLHRVVHKGTNYRVSIPFFFEPNFTAHVRPLNAALRIQKSGKDHGGGTGTDKKPVVYGDFLLAKVGNNFDKD